VEQLKSSPQFLTDRITGQTFDFVIPKVKKAKAPFKTYFAVSPEGALFLSSGVLSTLACRVLSYCISQVVWNNTFEMRIPCAVEHMAVPRQLVHRGITELTQCKILLWGAKRGAYSWYMIHPALGWKGYPQDWPGACTLFPLLPKAKFITTSEGKQLTIYSALEGKQ
jgi:hypothetical protein